MSIIRDHLDYSWPAGRSTRIKECDNCVGQGTSNAVQITRKEDGFLWHCFRCKRSGFFDDTGMSPAEAARKLAEDAKRVGKEDHRPVVVVLPPYAERMPPQAMVDLLDVSIELNDIDRFNIGWSPGHQRTVFPLYKYGSFRDGVWARKLIGWAGKKLSTDDSAKPKWNTVRQRDVKHPRFLAPPATGLSDRRIVLVEDPHSAIRISQLGYFGLSLLTTYLPYEIYHVLRGWSIKIWLDADAYDKALKYMSKLGQNGIVSDVIYTTKDPKHYSAEEMEGYLSWKLL